MLRKTKIDDVTPAKVGVQIEKLDSRFRGNDKYGHISFPLLEGVFD